MITYVTLSILLISAISFLLWLLSNLAKHDHLGKDEYYKPFKNKNKWWYS